MYADILVCPRKFVIISKAPIYINLFGLLFNLYVNLN